MMQEQCTRSGRAGIQTQTCLAPSPPEASLPTLLFEVAALKEALRYRLEEGSAVLWLVQRCG